MVFCLMFCCLFGCDFEFCEDVDCQEVYFCKVVEQSVDVICWVVEGQFCYVFFLVFNMFGWNVEKLIGMSGLDVIYVDDWYIVEEMMVCLVFGQ